MEIAAIGQSGAQNQSTAVPFSASTLCLLADTVEYNRSATFP